MSRPLTEIELRWVVPRIRSTRRSLRIGWTMARWVFRSCSLLCLVLVVPAYMDGRSWGALAGLVALGGFMGLLGLLMPTRSDGTSDPQETDSLQANWIRATPELLHVGSGKSASVIRTMAGAQLVAPSGWFADLPIGEEAEVEMVTASTPHLHANVHACIWLVAIRGKCSLRAELEAGCTDDPALAASLWWWAGGLLLATCLVVLLATSGFPGRELLQLPAAWSPRARVPATEGRILPSADLRPGDGIELGAHFILDDQRDPEESIPLFPWRSSLRDSFLQAAHGIRERMARASRAADSARSILWFFRPAFHNLDLQEPTEEYDVRSAKAFRREWPTRKAERKLWLARMDSLLPGDTAWAAFLRKVDQEFASVDSSRGDTVQGRTAAEALHREVLRLLHPDSSQTLLRTENAILRDTWARSVRLDLGMPLASGVLLVPDSAAPYPIPYEFDPGERWLLQPEHFDSAKLDSLPFAFRPAGAHAVVSHFEYGWTVVRLGEPLSLRRLPLSLRFWITFLAALPIWLSIGTWKILAWRRASAIAKAASTAWWTEHPEG